MTQKKKKKTTACPFWTKKPAASAVLKPTTRKSARTALWG